MKDTKQKTKETKQFRLQSILKLHTRILNQKLMDHAIGLEQVSEKLLVGDKEVAFNHLVDTSIDFALIGKHNFEVSEMASKLQLSSSQEELEALFKLVTKSKKDIKKELEEEFEEEHKCNCSCSNSKAKDTKSKTKQVKTEVIKIVATSKEEALEKINEIIENQIMKKGINK